MHVGASHYASSVETNNGIADHADVWSKGNAGLDLDQAETVTYLFLLENFEERFRIEWRHSLLFGQQGQQLSQSSEFAAFLHENPSARKIWTVNKDEFYASIQLIEPDYETHRFYNDVIDALKKYDALEN